MRKARAEALLAPLASTVEGTITDGRLRGIFDAYAVEAWPEKDQPIPDPYGAYSHTGGSSVRPGPDVNVLRLKLAGVPGREFWECSSYPTLPSQLVPLNITRLAYRLVRTEFKFPEHALNEAASGAWSGLIKRLGIPVPTTVADEALQERLVAAGLFEELSRLRWGSHPYLPKASFNPHAQALGQAEWEALRLQMKEGLRARGYGEYELAIDEKVEAAGAQNPGEVALEVEVGRDKVPTGARFRELLDAAVRIAQINAEANTSTRAA
jgi:hypothetical protein